MEDANKWNYEKFVQLEKDSVKPQDVGVILKTLSEKR